MINKISYAISQRFQWLFVAIFAVSYGVLSAVQILEQVHTSHNPWLRPATAIILLALNVMPVVVAIVAALMSREQSALRRTFYGAVVGYAWASIWSVVIMNLPTVYYRPEYFSNGLAAFVAATVLIAIALILDRWWHPVGVYRHWRTAGLGVVMVLVAALPVYTNIAMGSGYNELRVVAVVAGLSALALVLFRKLPWPERLKRLVLLAAAVSMVGLFASYALSLVTRSNMTRYWWVDPIFDLLVYGAGVWLLQSSTARRVET